MRLFGEIRNQKHLMIAEGTQGLADEKEIVEYITRRGYVAKNITISFDTMQDIFRWNCDIEKPPAED